MIRSLTALWKLIIRERRIGQPVAICALAVGSIILTSLLVAKSNSYVLFTLISIWIYCSIVLWVSFYRDGKKWFIPGMFIIVVLIPILRFLIGVGGGPVTWDELLYMNAAKNSVAEIRILNQYTHIHLLKVFYWLTGGDSLRAVRYYWIVTQSLVLTLVYLSIIQLTRRYTVGLRILCGMFGIFLFFIQPYVMEYIGVAYVDFTLELLFAAGSYLVILAFTTPNRVGISIYLIGLLFGFGLRTKEVSIVLVILAVGLLWHLSGKQRWFRHLLFFTLGVISAFAVLIIMNTIVLHDPLWGFRISDLQAWFSVRTGYDPGLKPLQAVNNIGALFFSASGICLLLITSVVARQTQSPDKPVFKVLVTFALLFIAVYSFIPFQAYPRYLIPIYPILAILAAPYLANLIGEEKSKILLFLLLIPIGIILSQIIENGFLQKLDPGIFTPLNVIGVFIIPTLLAGLILVILYVEPEKAYLKISLFCLLFFTGTSLYANRILQSWVDHAIQKSVNHRFQIIYEWKPDISTYPDKLLFASAEIKNGKEPIGITPDYTRLMINIALNGNLSKDSVITNLSDFLRADYSTYCFAALSSKDYSNLSSADKGNLDNVFVARESKNK